MDPKALIIPTVIAVTCIALLVYMYFFIKKNFHKCDMDEAIVRTGYGGPKVVIQGGIFVFRLFHQVQRVTLRTIKLDLRRHGGRVNIKGAVDIIRSADMLPIRINAEVYVHVPTKPDYIMSAARTLGEEIDAKTGITDKDGPAATAEKAAETKAQVALQDLTREKLHSALRGVVATLTVEELHRDHALVTDKVADILEADLKENGLELETIAIESMEPEPINEQAARESGNMFDVSAARTMTKKIQAMLVETNEIKKQAEVAIETSNTTASKERYLLQTDLVAADKAKDLEVTNVTVKTEADKANFEAETNLRMTQIVEDTKRDSVNLTEQAATDIETFQAKCENEKAKAMADYEKEYNIVELDRDLKIETYEHEVHEAIKIADLEQKKNIGIKASESKETVVLSSINTKKAIDVAEVARDEAQAVRVEERNDTVSAKEMEAARTITLTNEALAIAARAEEKIETEREIERRYREEVVPEENETLVKLENKKQLIIDADADKEKVQLAAQALQFTEERTRDGDIARGEGANALLALGRAVAESRRLKAEADVVQSEADLLDKDSVVSFLLAKNAPELAKNIPLAVEAAFKPLENIDSMKIIQVNSDGDNGENGSNAMGNLMKNAVQAVPLGAIVTELLSGAEGDQWKDLLQNAVGALGQFGKTEQIISDSGAESREITSTID